MKLLLLSDIHGNWPSKEAALGAGSNMPIPVASIGS